MDCQICVEYRLESNNPKAICGYCECDARNRAGSDPYAFVRIERLATRLKSPELQQLTGIIQIAEKITLNECGYTKEDLDQAIADFRSKGRI